jgi:hypothetical protein
MLKAWHGLSRQLIILIMKLVESVAGLNRQLVVLIMKWTEIVVRVKHRVGFNDYEIA